ncbi:hypothetical protein BVY01_01700 [bacterium I07]|nr:hypothetical protein BVY01_01700 [bacterium I07]
MNKSTDNIKTLLLRLPDNIEKPGDRNEVLQHYGITVISAYLKENGFDVTLLDAHVLKLNRKTLFKSIIDVQPDILGVPLYTQRLGQAISFLADLKKLIPRLVIVAGGPHPSTAYEDLLLNTDAVDIAVIGEGEYTLKDIIECIEQDSDLSSNNGIAYKVGNEITVTPARGFIQDLDALPFADWQALPMDKYWYPYTIKKNFTNMVLSRGCRYSCTFCGSKSALGRKVRRRSIENALAEIELLYNRFKVRQIVFNDSTFNSDNSWVDEFCEGLLRKNYSLMWECNIRGHLVDKHTLQMMKKSGCVRLFLGVESADNRMLKRMKKGESIEEIEEAVRIIDEVGITTTYGFILGMPGQDLVSMDKTLKFASKLTKGLCQFSIAKPYPGTAFFTEAQQAGFVVDDWSKIDLTGIPYVANGLSREVMQEYQNKAEKLTRTPSLRFSFLVKQLKEIKSFINFKIKLAYVMRLCKHRFIRV